MPEALLPNFRVFAFGGASLSLLHASDLVRCCFVSRIGVLADGDKGGTSPSL